MMPDDSPAVRVLLVDDQEIVRAGLRAVIGAAGIVVVGEAATVAEAIKAAARLVPDVVLMDVRLPDGSGVTACREIRATNPRIKVLFLTAFEDEEALIATVFASADGYLLKEIGSANLVQAVKAVAGGLSVLRPGSARSAMDKLRALATAACHEFEGEPLSKQERRVLELVAEGKTNKEIAAVMELSSKTVKNYLSNIFQKLQVTRRSQAVARMIRGTSK
jgi:two-component system, NarL family, response regulator DevR